MAAPTPTFSPDYYGTAPSAMSADMLYDGEVAVQSLRPASTTEMNAMVSLQRTQMIVDAVETRRRNESESRLTKLERQEERRLRVEEERRSWEAQEMMLDAIKNHKEAAEEASRARKVEAANRTAVRRASRRAVWPSMPSWLSSSWER